MPQETQTAIPVANLKAAAAIPTNTLVGYDGNVCGSANMPVGATNMAYDSGEMMGLFGAGLKLIIVGATPLTAGCAVQSDANGNVIPYSSGPYVGVNMSGAVAAGGTALISMAIG
jgi:hypothetical protein